MAIQVVCSLRLVQRADCYQNLGSCTSCSLCEKPLCLCGKSSPCSKCFVYKSPKEAELARTVLVLVWAVFRVVQQGRECVSLGNV